MLGDEGQDRILGEVNFTTPQAGDTVLLDHCDSLPVVGNPIDPVGVQRVRLLVHPPNVNPSYDDPGVVEVEVDPHTGTFSAQLGGARGNLEGTVENSVTAWIYLNGQWQGATTVPFCGQCPAEITVLVSAKHCVMFAWAPQGYTGPEIRPALERESGDLYQPTRVQVPVGATSVAISAQGSWTHHPPLGGPETSGPDGRDRTEATRAAYQNAAYQSQNIPLPDTNLNRLLALRQTDPDSPGVIDHLGEAETTLDVTGYSQLFLGFHDGYHWANNVGEVTVTLRWS
jgi:hypothetical protein